MLGANVLGQILNLVIQVVSVPLFLFFWGTEVYGEWLLISAIPSYIAISGTGIGFVAGNTMHRHIAAENTDQALVAFQSAWVLTIALSILMIILAIPIIVYSPIIKMMNVINIPGFDAKMTLAILVLYIAFSFQSELFSGAFRASGKLARSTTILTIIRFLEFACAITVVALGFKVVAAASTYLLIRVCGVIFMIFDLKRLNWPKLGTKYAQKSAIRFDLIPTLSFLGFPFGHACVFQGMTTVVGISLGPTAVVLFSTVRTLTGFIRQFSSTIYYAIWPEFSLALGSGQWKIARNLHRNSFQLTFVFALISSISIFFFGDWILDIWTGGTVKIDNTFLSLMLASTIPNTLWMMSSYVSISINRHTKIAIVYSLLALSSMILAFFLLQIIGIVGVPISVIIADIVLLSFVLKTSMKILGDTFKDFFTYVLLNIPLKRFYKINTKLLRKHHIP